MGPSDGRRPDCRYAAIYGRVSTDEQVKGYSISTQTAASQKPASDHAAADLARRF